jgi:hypothetical protein
MAIDNREVARGQTTSDLVTEIAYEGRHAWIDSDSVPGPIHAQCEADRRVGTAMIVVHPSGR